MPRFVPRVVARCKSVCWPVLIGLLASITLTGTLFCTQVKAQPSQRKAKIVEDRWSEPNHGVRYLLRLTDVPCRIHVLLVDLSKPGVKVVTTPYEQRWQTVSEFATRNRLAAATNGGFWGKMMRAWGVTSGGGKRWPTGEDDEEIGFFAVTKQGKAWINSPEHVVDQVPEERVAQAVSGMPQLVRQGHVDHQALEAFPYGRFRHPRSAVGVGKGGSLVILIVASGRQSHSRGLTLYELADLFVEFGAHDAINLDGGGSSTVFIAKEGGVVNSPSGGRWVARLGYGAEERKTRKVYRTRTGETGQEEAFVRGVEREVMNHIGVIAPPKTQNAASQTEPKLSKAPAVKVSKPRPPPFSLGRLREWVVPAFLAAVALGVLAVTALGIWWYRRRKRHKAQSGDAMRTK